MYEPSASQARCCGDGSVRRSQSRPIASRAAGFPAAALLLAVAVSVGATGVARAGIWTGNGPEGGNIQALAIHPTSPNTVYAGTDGGGVFKTTNGGLSWSAVNAGLTGFSVVALAVDSGTPTTVYAGT